MLVDSLARAALCALQYFLAEHLSKSLNMLPVVVACGAVSRGGKQERHCIGAFGRVLVDEEGPAVRVSDDGLTSIEGDGHAARGEKGEQLRGRALLSSDVQRQLFVLRGAAAFGSGSAIA